MKRIFIFLSIFIIHNVYADPINQDVLGGCDDTVLNTVNNIANLIPAFSPTVYTCSSGQFLPADTTECKSCPSGYTCAGGNMTFNENNLSGIDYRAPIPNSTQYTCSENYLHSNNNISNLIPAFSPTVYTCSSGQFLPADTTGCRTCPSGYTCAGGNMTFNENNLSGINDAPILRSTQYTCSENFLHANNNVANLIPVFEISIYDCNPGYYVPADTEGCTKCPNNHYCPGGTYTFNETESQGIEPCSSDYPFAPRGMWTASQCGRKLHIGDDILYVHQSPYNPSQHRLFIRIDNVNYSVNMSPKDINIPDSKMSIDANRTLHVKLDGVEYIVHDDSVE